MKKLFQNIPFNVGFWIPMSHFLVINCYEYIKVLKWVNAPIAISGCDYHGGFPFDMYGACYGNPNSLTIYWSILIMNLLAGIIFSVVTGLIFKNICSSSTYTK